MRRRPILALSFGVAACAGHAVRAPSADLAIAHVAVVDVAAGRALPDQTVLIAGDRIVSVAPSSGEPVAGRVVEGRGKYLIPGLWDLHVHTARNGRAAWMFPLFVANGVLGVRDTGSPLDSLLKYRSAAASGALLGPRIFGTGPVLDGARPEWPTFSIAVATPGEAARLVDSLAAAGVDFIKVYNGLSPEAFFAIARRARERHVPVIGHVPHAVDPVQASDSGMRSIEHFTLAVACLPTLPQLFAEVGAYAKRPGVTADSLRAFERRMADRAAAAYDEVACRAAGARFARNGTAFVPTLARERTWSRAYLASAEAGTEPELRYAPPAVRSNWVRWRDSIVAIRTADDDAEEEGRLRVYRSIVRALHASGTLVLAGTDTDGNDAFYFGVPGWSLHTELETLVRDAGFTHADALRAATLDAARFLGIADSVGTIARGQAADLVLLDADPLADIRNARRVQAVVRSGRLLDRAALDALLAREEAQLAGPSPRR